ncbi:MAG: hypothetical protein OHK0048_24190 [Rhodoferax sp.]
MPTGWQSRNAGLQREWCAQPGQTLEQAGHQSAQLFWIKTGLVSAESPDAWGRRASIGLLSDGFAIGANHGFHAPVVLNYRAITDG